MHRVLEVYAKSQPKCMTLRLGFVILAATDLPAAWRRWRGTARWWRWWRRRRYHNNRWRRWRWRRWRCDHDRRRGDNHRRRVDYVANHCGRANDGSGDIRTMMTLMVLTVRRRCRAASMPTRTRAAHRGRRRSARARATRAARTAARAGWRRTHHSGSQSGCQRQNQFHVHIKVPFCL